MNKNNRRIHWEKWVDPFGADTKQMEWPGAFGDFETDEAVRTRKGDEIGYDNIDDDEEEGFDLIKTDKRPTGFGIITTPMGIIPVTEHTNPTKIFNFWTMHTNFRITRDIQNIIDHTEGVECLDVFTPYRWRIAIGKAFKTNDVKLTLQENLNVAGIVNAKENG